MRVDQELRQPLPPPGEQQGFYEQLRTKVARWLGQKPGKRGRIADVVLFAPDLFHLLMKSMGDGRIDRKSKLLIASGILYFISPIDLLPEGLLGPGGYLDDVAVASFIVTTLIGSAGEDVLQEHWTGSTRLLNTLEKISSKGGRLISRLPAGVLARRYLKKK
ncbi:Uncharacterized membrane protein YkvA, DUF1232 family [Edaphobacillus lindanitolerans]|uniref:Uncharacterized membrane protein YkvA, DUF1232 family n=1 Tax=Edaphobacillus lindanitolerans TaxID=550447 RepID=A0A1U7PP33_9BACI|nr:Uncharacterized membrane protein YkvA, DUF1232 family [Edaphobacillus lindanitolerans]